jgi:hypothetical protein
MINPLGRVTSEIQARELSTTWWQHIRVRDVGRMRRMRMIRKGMVGFDRMKENEWGREEEGKPQWENPHD